jgi:iron complex outermembrane receptor protein
MADMRASKEVAFDATKNLYSGSGGSPTLDPYRANSVDLTYEKYFGNKAYLSAAAFYKDLKTYIVDETTTDFDWAPYVIAPPGQSTIGEFTRPVNGHGGNINGYELTASLPFNLMTHWLDGFGAMATYSHTDSSVTPPDLTGSGMPTMMLPGQSKEVGSYTVYFEKWGFSARYNWTTRSDFVGSITDQFGDHQLTYIKGEPVAAYQLGYDITSGALNGLSFLLQVNNANNAPYIEYKGTPDNVTKEQRFGRQVLFGLNYKL